MTSAQWIEATRPKMQGTLNLHDLLPKDMDFFIMLSSTVGCIGNYGQANYAAGNSFLDSFARHRTRQGLAAHTINVGIVSDEDDATNAALLHTSGFESTSLSELLAVLEYVVDHPKANDPALSQTILHLPIGSQAPPCVINDPRFADWLAANNATLPAVNDPSESNSQDVRRALQNATSLSEMTIIMNAALLEALGRLLTVPPASLDPGQTLLGCGVDSLAAVELRNWIAVELKANVSLLEMLQVMSIGSLVTVVVQRSTLVTVEQ